MAVVETKRIRNVALLGHGGCGKTSLSEALLYITGATDRIGKVADGNTVSDYDSEEIKEKIYPELDDDFASEASEFDTLDEMKADIRKKRANRHKGK